MVEGERGKEVGDMKVVRGGAGSLIRRGRTRKIRWGNEKEQEMKEGKMSGRRW